MYKQNGGHAGMSGESRGYYVVISMRNIGLQAQEGSTT